MNISFILDEPWNSSLTFLGKAFLESLQKAHNISVLCLQNSYIDKNLNAEKFHIDNLRTKNPINLFKNLKTIREHFKVIKPQIVFSIRGDASFLACLLKKQFHFKLIRIFGENRAPRINKHCVDYVFLSSKKYAQNLDLPHSIINGVVDTNKFIFTKEGRSRIREEFGIDYNTFVFGFIGRTSKVKGIFMLLEAFARLPENVKLFILTYETEIKIKDILDFAKKTGIKDRIILESRLRDDVANIISAFDVGVVSSIDSEAIARVALEYISCGIPCVVTNVGCLTQVIDSGCGIVCEPTVQSLSRSLLEIKSKNLSDLSNNAKIKAAEYSKGKLNHLLNEFLAQLNDIDKNINLYHSKG